MADDYCLAVDMDGDRPLFNLCDRPKGHLDDHGNDRYSWPQRPDDVRPVSAGGELVTTWTVVRDEIEAPGRLSISAEWSDGAGFDGGATFGWVRPEDIDAEYLANLTATVDRFIDMARESVSIAAEWTATHMASPIRRETAADPAPREPSCPHCGDLDGDETMHRDDCPTLGTCAQTEPTLAPPWHPDAEWTGYKLSRSYSADLNRHIAEAHPDHRRNR